MSAGGATRETFRLWSRTASRVIPAALLLFLPLELLAALFDPANDIRPNQGLYLAVFAATSVVAMPWAAGAIVRYLHDGGSALGAYGKVDGVRLSLVAGCWLAGIGVLIGLVLLIVPGLILAARWSALDTRRGAERRGPIESFRRSNALVEGATGRTLAVLAVAMVAGLALTLIPTTVAELAWPGLVASVVYSLAFDVLLLPLVTTAAYVVYRQRLSDAEARSGDAGLPAPPSSPSPA